MSDRSRAGRATGSLLLLLLLVGGAGAWNYHRNLEIEKQTEGLRPYKSYAAEDLEALRSAYAAELEGVRAQLTHARSQRTRVAGDQGSISKNVEQFKRTTRTSAAIREAAGNVAERESQIAQLDEELELRARFGQGLMRHWKRLITI